MISINIIRTGLLTRRALFVGSTTAAMGVNFYSSILLARQLNVSSYGEYIAAASVAGIGGVAIDPGYGAFLSREMAQGRIHISRAIALFYSYGFGVWMVIIGVIAVCAISPLAPINNYLLVGLPLLLQYVLSCEWILAGLRRPSLVGVNRLFGATLWLVVQLTCISEGTKASTVAQLRAFALLATALGCWISLGIRVPKFTRRIFRAQIVFLKRTLPFLRLQLAQLALTSVPALIVAATAIVADVAMYGVLMQAVGCVLIPSILAHVGLSPYLAATYSRDRLRFRRIIRRYYMCASLYSAAVIAVWFALGSHILNWLFGHRYNFDDRICGLAVVGAIFQVLSAVGTQALIAAREEREASRANWVGVALSVAIGGIGAFYLGRPLSVFAGYSCGMVVSFLITVRFVSKV